MNCIAEQLPVRNVVLMFAMAAGTWVLLISMVAGVLWRHHPLKTDIALLENSRDGQPLVSQREFPQLKARSPVRAALKKGRRRFPPLVARIFSPKTSVN